MSEQNQQRHDDSVADAVAAIAILALVVATAVYWLSGMPG